MTYERLTDVEHVLKRPDMYVGSMEKDKQMTWVFEEGKIIEKELIFSPALPKLFDEAMANAVDNHIRGRGTSKIAIVISSDSITIENNGKSIPFDLIGTLPTPTVLFGCLRSGENFDDSSTRSTGGKNGYGIKLANIFSTEFQIDIVHAGRRFRQTWKDNMMSCLPEKITNTSRKNDMVKIHFKPDFKRFDCQSLDDMQGVLTKRALDAVFCYPTLSVLINGKRIFKKANDFLNSLYDGTKVISHTSDWTVCVFRNDVGHDIGHDGKHMSFVNGISTSRGGTHVKHVLKKITQILSKGLSKRKLRASPKLIKDSLFVVIRTDVINPVFESQCKTLLTTKSSKFTSQWQPTAKFCKTLLNSSIFEHLVEVFSNKLDKQLAKQDGKKSASVKVKKLIDAKYAGTRRSSECILILAEGDSALSMLLKGVISNRLQKTVGLFPLRGKLLNCATASKTKLIGNHEIQAVKKIIGLSNGKTYNNFDGLRYGQVLVATDADDDGQHILGLVLTMFHKLYPNLVSMGFISRFITPLLMARRGGDIIEFFTLDEYKEWSKLTPEHDKYLIKFYKGLGSSTNADAKRYFSNMTQYTKKLKRAEMGLVSLNMFFSKEYIEERKAFVKLPKHEHDSDTLDGFIKGPLHAYARSSLIRAIPSIDGFKESTRKIMWTCLSKKMYGDKKDIKVSELAGLVSTFTHYHHGETSLQGAIITLARRFQTVNTLPLLVDSGQFGSFVGGGNDSASARYIFTHLEENCKFIFNSADFEVLPRNRVDGELAECKLLAPLLPWTLVNGATGIATGFSTNIYPYCPLELIANVKNILNGKKLSVLAPSFRNWNGSIQLCDGFFISSANYSLISSSTIKIRCLPIGMFPQTFIRTLEKLKIAGTVQSFDVEHLNMGPQFRIVFKSLCDMPSALSLKKKHSLKNMHLLDSHGVLRKYESAEDILREFVSFRLRVIEKRIDYQLQSIDGELSTLSDIQKFISLFLDGVLEFKGKSDEDVCEMLTAVELNHLKQKLLNLPIRRLTQREIEVAGLRILKLKERRQYLLSTTPSSTYLQELDKFSRHLSTTSKRASDCTDRMLQSHVHKKKKINN